MLMIVRKLRRSYCNYANRHVFRPIILLVILMLYIIFVTTLIFYTSRFGNRIIEEHIKRVSKMTQMASRNKQESCNVINNDYLFSSPPGDACYLRQKLNKPNMPVIHSFFADEATESVIFVGVKWLSQNWHQAAFVCVFDNGDISMSDPVVQDGRSFGYLTQFLIVVTCSMPKIYLKQSNFTLSLSVLNITNLDEAFVDTYENLTVCRPGIWPVKRYFLAMCTMVRNMDTFLPEWVEYHAYIGVEHFYIYDNAPYKNSTLRETMKPYIDAGYVTVVPWPHRPSSGKTFLEIQIAHENDCIWRHKHDVDWMIKVDVDEFVQPMNPLKTKIPDYLIDDSTLETLSSIRLDNWFFGRPNRTTFSYRSDSIFERNQYRPGRPHPQNIGRDKNILQLKNVYYFKIHGVKLGGSARSADPYHELRMVHYRMDNPRHRTFDLPDFRTLDTSMVQIWTEAKRHFDQILGRS
ncbi:uncharacterized protein [Amphiura filiformis]|uniref:uncharacterized protein n=1 Tax=Amphiura filiformis TaxID=82378 RepID=UPI003B20F635